MSSGTKTALWVGGAVVGVGVVGGVAWYMMRKKEEEANGEAQPPGNGPIPGVPVPPIPPIPVPLPPPPVPIEPDGPEDAIGGAVDTDMPPPVPGVAAQNLGARVNATDQTIFIVDQDAWIDYAGQEIKALNVEEWTSAQLMDRVWEKAFPFMGPSISLQGGWTVNGQPYEEITARGQLFIDALLAGDITVPDNFPGHETFARLMTGEEHTPLKVLVDLPENKSIWELWQVDKANVGLHHVLLRFLSTFEPAAGQHVSRWVYYIWAPGITSLAEGNAMKTSAKETRNKARKEAFDFVNEYATISVSVAEG